MEENIDKQDRVIATEGSDIEIDKDGGSGTTLHGVVEEREEEENASEKEDEVDEEEEGEEKEDGGYTFRFENGMNPLDFFDSGVQCYQQLQQHEEEALANKKQKSPECPRSECNEGNSFKKAREADISEEKWAEVMEAMNIGGHRRSRKRKQPKKRGRRKGSKKKLDERLSQMLGDANLHYSNCSFDKAIAVLHEVVRLEPNLPDSYHILGLVHKELGDYKKETEFYMIAAILTPKYSSIGQKVEDLLADPENEKWLSISSEFCGGTHISNTRDAKAFALLAEEGIAKEIRRVTAVTTDRAYDAIKMADEFEQQVDDASKLEGSLLEELMTADGKN